MLGTPRIVTTLIQRHLLRYQYNGIYAGIDTRKLRLQHQNINTDPLMYHTIVYTTKDEQNITLSMHLDLLRIWPGEARNCTGLPSPSLWSDIVIVPLRVSAAMLPTLVTQGLRYVLWRVPLIKQRRSACDQN